MSIEAMKQALEALENTYALRDDVIAAKASLRQAIAEAEKQEPIGYLEIEDVEDQREYPHNCRAANLWHEGGEGLVAVYTHSQPKREPLTDEQIIDLWPSLIMHQHTYAFARAIEAAHGIKGQL